MQYGTQHPLLCHNSLMVMCRQSHFFPEQDKITNSVFRDVVRTFYQGVLNFQNVTQLHGAHTNKTAHMTSCTPVRKIQPPKYHFSHKLSNAEQCYVQISHTKFWPNQKFIYAVHACQCNDFHKTHKCSVVLHGGSATKFHANQSSNMELQPEINLCPSGKYQCHSYDFRESERCSTTL